jgi:hypothetical protein
MIIGQGKKKIFAENLVSVGFELWLEVIPP